MKKVLLFLLVFLSINVKVYALEEDLFKVDFEKDILKSQEWKDCNGDTNYSCRSTIIGQHLTVNNDRVYFYKMYMYYH